MYFIAFVSGLLIVLAFLGGCSNKVTDTPTAATSATTTTPTAPVATTPPVTESPSPTTPPVTVTVTATNTVTVTQQPTPPVKPSVVTPTHPKVAATPGASLDPLLSRIPVLKSVGAKCPLAHRGNYPPAFNDGGNALAFIYDVAAFQPSVSAMRCAQGRLRAGGFTLLSPNQQLQHPSLMSSPNYPLSLKFHVIWARIGHNNSAKCVFPFTVIDYQGNIALFNDGEPIGMDRDGVGMTNWNAQQIRQAVQVAFDNC